MAVISSLLVGSFHPCATCPIDMLSEFCALTADASTSDEIVPLLADAALGHLGASGVAVFQVTESAELRLDALRNLPEGLRRLHMPVDALGGELEGHLHSILCGQFPRIHILPLISAGGLFGALALFFSDLQAMNEHRSKLAQALANLAAITLHRTFEYAELSRSYIELRASREILTRSEKLRALGQMASGVSHDLKNILSPLLLQVQHLRRCPDLDSETQERTLERMERVLWSGVQTVDRLRSFGRQTPELPPLAVYINEIVKQAASLCRSRLSITDLGPKIALIEELSETPMVQLHGDEFLNALINLISNSMDAIAAAGGTIRVRTAQQDGRAMVQIADNGPGIPKEVEGRIFEPYFTTKGETGTGLGLAQVYAFVQRHNGTLSLDNVPGGGATFTMVFPAAVQEN